MKTILVLTDFSRKSEHAAKFAISFASTVKADVLLYNSIITKKNAGRPQQFIWALEEYLRTEDQSKKKLKALADKLKVKIGQPKNGYEPSVSFLCQQGEPGELGRNVKNIVQRRKIWMVVMAAKSDNSLSNFISGTSAYSVTKHAVCPVLLIPVKAPIKQIRKIVIATDLNRQFLHSQPLVEELTTDFNGEIVVPELFQQNTVNIELKEQNIEAFFNDKTDTPDISDIYSDPGDGFQSILKNNTDLLGIVHKKENMFQNIFKSPYCDLLTNNSILPLFVIPLT